MGGEGVQDDARGPSPRELAAHCPCPGPGVSAGAWGGAAGAFLGRLGGPGGALPLLS